MAQDLPPPDVIPGMILGQKDKTRYLGAIISRDHNVAPWVNASLSFSFHFISQHANQLNTPEETKWNGFIDVLSLTFGS